jgi:hypothetical protein
VTLLCIVSMRTTLHTWPEIEPRTSYSDLSTGVVLAACDPQTRYAKRQGWPSIAPALTTPTPAEPGSAKAAHAAAMRSSAAVSRRFTAHQSANGQRAALVDGGRSAPPVSSVEALSLHSGPRDGTAPALAGSGLVASGLRATSWTGKPDSQPMADLFVMCPDCGIRAKVIGATAKIVASPAKCKHRQNPLNCPLLAPLISKLLRSPTPTIDRR